MEMTPPAENQTDRRAWRGFGPSPSQMQRLSKDPISSLMDERDVG